MLSSLNAPAPTETYTLSLHDALPISGRQDADDGVARLGRGLGGRTGMDRIRRHSPGPDDAAPRAPGGGPRLHRRRADAWDLCRLGGERDVDQREDAHGRRRARGRRRFGLEAFAPDVLDVEL